MIWQTCETRKTRLAEDPVLDRRRFEYHHCEYMKNRDTNYLIIHLILILVLGIALLAVLFIDRSPTVWQFIP